MSPLVRHARLDARHGSLHLAARPKMATRWRAGTDLNNQLVFERMHGSLPFVIYSQDSNHRI